MWETATAEATAETSKNPKGLLNLGLTICLDGGQRAG